jgi:biotin carboxylase
MRNRFVQIDLKRPEWSAQRIEELAGRTAIDAIVPVDDGGVLIAALASRRLGLLHSAPDAVAKTRNKAMMRRALDVPQPAFVVTSAGDDIEAVARAVGPPVVLKPISLSGSRGVIRVDDPADAPGVSERIRRILATAGENPNAPLVVERFVPGSEIALEGVLRAGRLEVLAVFDKPDPLDGPYFPETIFVTPSRLHPEMLMEARDIVQRAAAGLGLAEGPIHAELRVDGSRIWFLELAARSIGGLCSRALRFGMMSMSLETLLLRHALDLPIHSLEREKVASGVMMLPITRAGVLETVEGTEAARDVPGITGLEITIPPGRPIVPLPEGDRYLGFLFAKGENPAAVEQALRDAFACLTVVVST